LGEVGGASVGDGVGEGVGDDEGVGVVVGLGVSVGGSVDVGSALTDGVGRKVGLVLGPAVGVKVGPPDGVGVGPGTAGRLSRMKIVAPTRMISRNARAAAAACAAREFIGSCS
jgi:hypothetical protein